MPKYLIEGELGIPHDELENAIRILEEADFCRFYDDEYVCLQYGPLPDCGRVEPG